jgi:hypothetical protein
LTSGVSGASRTRTNKVEQRNARVMRALFAQNYFFSDFEGYSRCEPCIVWSDDGPTNAEIVDYH